LFALIFGGKQVASLIQENIQPGPIKLRAGLNHLGKLLLFLLVFTAVIFPYIHAVKQRFGKYFYNVNTTVYIWYENYDQALEEEAKYHFMEHWPQDLNASQIPGFQKYMREHSLSQIVERFRIGVGKVFQNVIRQHGVFNYWLGMVILFLSAIFIDLRNSLRTARRYPILILFIVLYFCGYFIAFSWYSHIAGGRRFLFSLYIPVLVTVFLGINALAKNQNTTLDRKHYRVSVARFFQASNIILAFILVYDAWLILTKVMFFGRFGS
jgi:hypothetical protein